MPIRATASCIPDHRARALLDRFSEAGAAAFVQPVFIDYDMDICESRVQEKPLPPTRGELSAFGVPVAFGTTAR